MITGLSRQDSALSIADMQSCIAFDVWVCFSSSSSGAALPDDEDEEDVDPEVEEDDDAGLEDDEDLETVVDDADDDLEGVGLEAIDNVRDFIGAGLVFDVVGVGFTFDVAARDATDWSCFPLAWTGKKKFFFTNISI